MLLDVVRSRCVSTVGAKVNGCLVASQGVELLWGHRVATLDNVDLGLGMRGEDDCACVCVEVCM